MIVKVVRANRNCDGLKSLISLLLLSISCAFLSCTEARSRSDIQAFERLKARYGDRYRFEFTADVYLDVHAKSTNTPDGDEITAISKAFFLNTDGGIRKDQMTYLVNFFDFRGKFICQTSVRSGSRIIISYEKPYH